MSSKKKTKIAQNWFYCLGIKFAPCSFETQAWGEIYKDTTHNYVHLRRIERCANEANRNFAIGIFTFIVVAAVAITTEDCFCVSNWKWWWNNKVRLFKLGKVNNIKSINFNNVIIIQSLIIQSLTVFAYKIDSMGAAYTYTLARTATQFPFDKIVKLSRLNAKNETYKPFKPSI